MASTTAAATEGSTRGDGTNATALKHGTGQRRPSEPDC
jgi:hypothetical protein